MKRIWLILCLASTAAHAAAASDPLPPIPIDRTQPGIASITDESSAEPVNKKWSIRYAADRRAMILACTATYMYNGKSGGTTRDYFIPVTLAQLEVASNKLAKAQEWTRLTRDRNPPPFRKSMGTVDGGEWTYVWSGERAIVLAQKVTLSEDDWGQFERLIPVAKDVIAEQDKLQKSAQDFVDSLK